MTAFMTALVTSPDSRSTSMHSFEPGFITAQPMPHGLVRSLVSIGELKGKETLYRRQSPQVLDTLRRASVISSAESSNRIEGIVASRSRIEALVDRRATPQNRSEQEIAGYREVLDTIHAHHQDLPLTSNFVLQLHRDLFQYTATAGGRWKATDNEIVERMGDGTVRLRFRPVSAVATPAAMDALHERFERAWQEQQVEPTLLIGAYVLDFLCIHPFLDGNGRMARLLSLLLLYKAGFGVGRFISLEQIVERTRASYYDTLAASSAGWHEGEHTLVPWWEYFSGVLLAAYRDFESRVGDMEAPRGSKGSMVSRAIERMPNRFRYADVAAECPGVSRPTIRRALVAMRDAGAIRCLGTGRSAEWEKLG